MSIFRMIGKRHIEMASAWSSSAAAFGATGGAAILYFTDWKVVLQYLPYYNGKFATEEKKEN